MNKHRHTAELSLILGFCDISKDKLTGRLASLRQRLCREVERQSNRLGYLSDADVAISHRLITQFYVESGWGAAKHTLSRLSFYLGFADKWPKIMAVLMDFQHHFDRAGRGITLCEISGERALEIWEAICRE